MAKAKRELLIISNTVPLEVKSSLPSCYGGYESLCSGEFCHLLNDCKNSNIVNPSPSITSGEHGTNMLDGFSTRALIPKHKTYVLCNTPKLLDWAFSNLEKAVDISFDIETTHPTAGEDRLEIDPNQLPIGWSFSWSEDTAVYMPLYLDNDGSKYWKDEFTFSRIISRAKGVLENPAIYKHLQNQKFDSKHIAMKLDIHIKGFCYDTMLMHHLLDENRISSSHGLDEMAARYIDPIFLKYYEILQKALDFYDPKMRRYSKVPLEILWPYACADADATRTLALLFERMLKAEGKLFDLYHNIVGPLSEIIAVMEMTGLDADTNRVEANKKNLSENLIKLQLEACQVAGVQFDLGSPEQLGRVLFEHLKLSGGKRNKIGWSTDKEILSAHQDSHPVVPLAQEYRKQVKLLGTYVEGLDKRLIAGRYYPPWNQNGTVSGRFSTELVNLLPREEHGGATIKGQFKAPEGHVLLFRDLSQIELRIGAHVSQDPFMMDGYINGGKDFDLHAKTATGVFKLTPPPGWENPYDFSWVKTLYKQYRSIAKNINFLSAYGGGANKLHVMVNKEYPEKAITLEEARFFIEEYYRVMSGLDSCIKATHLFLAENGYVESIFGRRRRLPDGMIKSWGRLHSRTNQDCFGKDSPRFSQLGVAFEDVPELRLTTEDAISMVSTINERVRKDNGLAIYDKCVRSTYFPNGICPDLNACLFEKERKNRNRIIGDARRQAFNFMLQSGAADYTNLSLIKIWDVIKANNMKSRPVLQIHDALGFLVPYAEVEAMLALSKDKMENAYKLSVPITSEAGVAKYWGEEDNKKPGKECKTCKGPISVLGETWEPLGEVVGFTEYKTGCTNCGYTADVRIFNNTEQLF